MDIDHFCRERNRRGRSVGQLVPKLRLKVLILGFIWSEHEPGAEVINRRRCPHGLPGREQAAIPGQSLFTKDVRCFVDIRCRITELLGQGVAPEGARWASSITDERASNLTLARRSK